MKEQSKLYVKHGCGHTMVAYSTKENVCKCGYKFDVKEYGNLSHWQDQKVGHNKFPKILKRGSYIDRDGKLFFRDASVTLSEFRFNLGRITKRLLNEIRELGKPYNVHISDSLTTKCTDGRTRLNTIVISWYHPKAGMELWLNLESRYTREKVNNKIINEKLRAFISDMKALKDGKNPEQYYDATRRVVETIMEYQY